MYKIGDFSKLSRITVKALRYYDQVGLLKPLYTDQLTGYRYYSASQLPRLHRILALKDLGLSLEQIAGLLQDELSADQLRGMLKLKQAELHDQIRSEQERLERVEARLRQIEQEHKMSNYDVVIKQVEPLLVASVRDVIPSYPEQGHLWNELMVYLEAQKAVFAGACMTIYHSDEPEIDAEVCQPLQNTVNPTDRVMVYQLPAVAEIACTIHHGPFVTLSSAYEAIIQWIEANGYRITGACREIYLQEPSEPGSQTDPETVTEIQFPIKKV